MFINRPRGTTIIYLLFRFLNKVFSSISFNSNALAIVKAFRPYLIIQTVDNYIKTKDAEGLLEFTLFIFGVLIIENHNVWEANWTVIITIIGWVALLKGILLLAFPTKLDFFKSKFSNDSFLKLLTPLVLLFGLIFLYLGFMS